MVLADTQHRIDIGMPRAFWIARSVLTSGILAFVAYKALTTLAAHAKGTEGIGHREGVYGVPLVFVMAVGFIVAVLIAFLVHDVHAAYRLPRVCIDKTTGVILRNGRAHGSLATVVDVRVVKDAGGDRLARFDLLFDFADGTRLSIDSSVDEHEMLAERDILLQQLRALSVSRDLWADR